MPDLSLGRSACPSWLQSLKAPMTHTRSASGAHTAKYVPSTPPAVMGWAPSFSYRRRCVPSLNRYRSSWPSSVTSPAAAGFLGALGLGALGPLGLRARAFVRLFFLSVMEPRLSRGEGRLSPATCRSPRASE